MIKKPKQMGRPRQGRSVMAETIPVRMPPEILELVDKARQLRSPILPPPRSVAIREWIIEGAQRWIAEAEDK
jgi:hypothetical protein